MVIKKGGLIAPFFLADLSAFKWYGMPIFDFALQVNPKLNLV